MAYSPQASSYGKYIDLQNYTGSAAPTSSGSLWMSGTAALPIFYTNVGMDVGGTFDCSGKITTDAGIEGASLVLASGATCTAILDEDGMGSNSATALATQQSIKAYVDAQVTAQDLDGAGDSGTFAVDLDSQSLSIVGTSNEIATAASGQTLTISLPDDVTIGDAIIVTGQLDANGDCNLGNATSDTITATGRFDSDLVPSSDSARDLGSSALQWAEVHADAGHIDAMTVTGTSTLGAVTATTISGSSTLSAAGAIAGNSTLTMQGLSALQAVTATTVSGSSTLQAGGAISGNSTLTIKGASTLKAVTATTVSGSSTLQSGGNFTVGPAQYGLTTAGAAKIASMSANWTNAGRTVADMGTVTTMDLNGGSIDGTVIGGASVAAGSFAAVIGTTGTYSSTLAANGGLTATTVSGSGAASLKSLHCDSVNLDGGNIDGTIIGAASAAAGTFAALVGTSLSVSDGNITNVGVLETDTVQSDAGAAGLNINFDGNTGTNKLSLTDNLASALDATQGANSYMKFVTSDDSEKISFGTTPIVEFLSTGGSSGDADVDIKGYAQVAEGLKVDAGGLTVSAGASTFSAAVDVASGGLSANSLKVDDLTDTRLLLAGTSGEVEDSANLTYDGSTFDIAAAVSVDGDITLDNDHDVKARSFITYSDAKLKTNVETVTNAMDMIQGLRGVSYDLKTGGKREFGFIAQEVNNIVPEVVSKNGNLMGIDYTRITSLLVEAVKTQQAQIEDLKAKLDK